MNNAPNIQVEKYSSSHLCHPLQQGPDKIVFIILLCYDEHLVDTELIDNILKMASYIVKETVRYSGYLSHNLRTFKTVELTLHGYFLNVEQRPC